MVDSSFYGDTPNYATDYPTQNDSNTNPVAGNTAAPSSFYPNGGVYEALADSDTVIAEMTALEAQAQADATAASGSATNAAASAAAAAASAATAGTLFLQKANNLSDLASVATAKANLSLVKGDVGLGNVDNTSDVNKPVSTAQATADALVASNAATANALKANIASPALTGVPTAPNATALTNNTQIANTAYADAAVGVEKARALAAEALKAPLASPALTGVPTAPTATVGTNTTQIATTAFVLASSSSVSIQDTAPSSPQPGALWWNSATGLLYVYYNDGNSSQWVFAASGAVQNAVLFDGPQALNSTQKAQARTNMGGVGAVKVQTFIASGTYTPDPNLLYAVIECLGGGGSGGSCVALSGQFACGSGGGGGAYARKTVSKATVGVSQTVTVGAGGAAPAAGANNGNTGGTTSVGSLCSAVGGNGGGFCQTGVSVSPGAGGGATGTGDLVVLGGSGGGASITQAMSVGWGGSSYFGGTVNVTFNAGTPAVTASGCGGAGAFDTSGTTNRPGGAGGSGAVIITEYCTQ